MPMNRWTFIILMLISISPKISGQEKNLLDEFCTHFEVEEHEHEFHVHTDYSNEIKTLGSVMFLFYKEFISSGTTSTDIRTISIGMNI